MVQLNTTYDKDIHQKVFVLKGEEGYARTTDVIASLVEFSDSESAISHGRYGIAVKVLRNIGDSTIAVYDNDVLMTCNDGSTLENIIWYEDMSSATMPSGMTWDNTTQTLTIGLPYGASGYDDSGVELTYDIEHNIVVKYLGNKQCLKSSDKITTTIPTPSGFNTVLTASISGHNNSNIYRYDETVNLTATLTDGNGVAMANKPILIYINDELIDDTQTTNSSGVLNYSPSLENGLNNVSFVYAGETDTYYPSNDNVELSFGYDLNVDCDLIWLNGIGGFTVTVKDYYDNPISDLDLSVRYSSTSQWITETTNSIGVATFTNQTHLIDLYSSLTVISEYDDESDPFSPTVVYMSTYDITGDNLETWRNGERLSLTVTATGEDIMGNSTSIEGLKVSMTNATPSEIILDENGSGTVYYEPNGNGKVTVTANFQDQFSDSITVSDAYQVWKDGTQYSTSYYAPNCNINEVSTGWKLSPISSSVSAYINHYDLNNPDISYEVDWSLKFDVISATSKGLTLSGLSVSTITTGDTVEIRSVNEMIYVYVNNSLKSSGSSSSLGFYFPQIRFNTSGNNQNIIINNLILKEI